MDLEGPIVPRLDGVSRATIRQRDIFASHPGGDESAFSMATSVLYSTRWNQLLRRPHVLDSIRPAKR